MSSNLPVSLLICFLKIVDGSFGWCPRSFTLDGLARTLTADSNGTSTSRPRNYSLARASEARPWRGANRKLIHTNDAAETCGSSGGLDIAWVSGQVWSLMLLDDSDASAEVPIRMLHEGAEMCVQRYRL